MAGVGERNMGAVWRVGCRRCNRCCKMASLWRPVPIRESTTTGDKDGVMPKRWSAHSALNALDGKYILFHLIVLHCPKNEC